MAKEENTEEETQPVEKKSNMLMIIIIIVLILIILIGAVVGILLMGGDEEEAVSSAPQAKEQSASKSSSSSRRSSSSIYDDSRQLSEIGILYPLDTFAVNLKSDAGSSLKVTMSLELEGDELSLELDAKSPALRDRIIRILTSKTLEEISSKKGKQKVSTQVMDTLNTMISDGQIKGVYFTECVIQ